MLNKILQIVNKKKWEVLDFNSKYKVIINGSSEKATENYSIQMSYLSMVIW